MSQPASDTDLLIPPYVARYAKASPSTVELALDWLQDMTFRQWLAWYDDWCRLEHDPDPRRRNEYHKRDNNAVLGLCDRYFLLVHLLGRSDMLRTEGRAPGGPEWLYDRCREVEAEPDDCLDLWAREHFKSTTITFAGVLQEALRNPEMTICIFSDVGKVAKPFLRQIMSECETNEFLKYVYSDVLWPEPKREAPSWSLQNGITFKRRGNPKEATVEAHGLLEGAPTGRHYNLRVYDDIVTRETVTNPEMVQRVTSTWELSDNLGAQPFPRKWHIGTRYTLADTYQTILDRKVLKPRIYPATDDGRLDGEPVLFDREEWERRKRTQPTTVAAQMLQNPAAGNQAMFLPAWLRGFDIRPLTLNVYILCDPAKGPQAQRGKGQQDSSDNTAMAVIGFDAQSNFYLLDGYRHRMNLDERWKNLLNLHRKWSKAKGVLTVSVGYEQYGMQSDIEHFQLEMERIKYEFLIEEVNWPRQGEHSKAARVGRLVPPFKNSKFYLPLCVWHETFDQATWKWNDEQGRIEHLELQGDTRLQREMTARGQGYRVQKPIMRRDEDNQVYDLTRAFIEEYLYFPFGTRKDLIDAVSRIYELKPSPPNIAATKLAEPVAHVDT